MAEGYGPVLKLYFTVSPSGTPEQVTEISLDGFGNYAPNFAGPVLDYEPRVGVGLVSLPYICGDANGNNDVSILDITFLLSYLYRAGASPAPQMAGDANGSGFVNILDVTYLIIYLYKNGPAPACP